MSHVSSYSFATVSYIAPAGMTPAVRQKGGKLVAQTKIKVYTTRYLGSKVKLLDWIWQNTKDLEFESIFDAFAGTGVVGYMFKQIGKTVYANDFLRFNYFGLKGLIENGSVFITKEDLNEALKEKRQREDFIERNYTNLFFPKEDTVFLDNLYANLRSFDEPKRSILMFCAVQAILKRASYGRFTTTRMSSLGKKTIKQYFVEIAERINDFIFDNGRDNKAYCMDVMNLISDIKADAVYFDPPYGGKSFSKYEHFYNFCEVYANYWKDKPLYGKLKQVKDIKSPFSYGKKHRELFEELLERSRHIPVWIFSYNNNGGLPLEVLVGIVQKHKSSVRVVEKDYEYAQKNGRFKEFLIIAQ